jgi:hypothetical protein
MPSEYQIGDEVTIIDSWSNDEWVCTFNHDGMDEYVNNGLTYTIREIAEVEDGTIYLLSNYY